MDSVIVNTRKNELLTQQELVLNQAQEAKRKLTDVEENTFNDSTAEIANID